MFIKLGESIEINSVEDTNSCIPMVHADILESFRKTAAELKKVAPRADDFLYFSAVMMHAAEASALNDDGSPKLTSTGEEIKVGWDDSNGTLRWVTNDSRIKPYKNANNDIFPAAELIKAHKKWIHKPLCIDHKSSSVDHTRGFIVDTYYDHKFKRVIALCALDKVNYPDLARKVSSKMQTCVSMGTAVGKAICTELGCHRVARSESDFCQHMKYKTAYGEINTELNPIELSIVVNGADPKAHIKTVIAAAQTMNSYLETREKELSKIAETMYSATLSRNDSDNHNIPSTNGKVITVNSTDLESFHKDVEKGLKDLATLNANISENSEKDTNDLAFNQSSGTFAMEETNIPNTNVSLAPPHERLASIENQLREITAAIEIKLNGMKESLNKLSISTKQEENMSSKEMNKKGYFQGTEEPTPGQPRYPADKTFSYEDDAHMKGQKPFPGVGDVEDLHPGTESSGIASELERKKMLARAEAEERALNRQAAVNLAKQALKNKQSWFQNGEGDKNPNTPTPGKPKYPVDKTFSYEDDTHMKGQKPFPGVGKVDDLHPSPESVDVSDELKRKQMLRRAGTLSGTFIKQVKADGSRDIDNSAWEVKLGENLILKASVKDLSGGRSEMMYDSINTPEFGQKLIEKVKVYGADKVKSLLKIGQQPEAPAPEAPVVETPAPEVDAPVADTGKAGDLKDSAVELAEKARDVNSDLLEAVRALTGEQSEMGNTSDLDSVASNDEFSLSHMNSFKKELNEDLVEEMKKTIAKLTNGIEELETIAGICNKNVVNASNEEFIGTIADDVINETKTAVADGCELMVNFVKYTRGTNALNKRAEIEAELEAMAAEGDENNMHDESTDLMNLINDANDDLNSVKEMMDENDHEDLSLESLEPEDLELEDLEHEHDDNDLMAKPDELKDLEVKPGTTVQVTAGFDTKEGRTAIRAKLAAEATGKMDDGQLVDMSKAKYSDWLDKAHALADGEVGLDEKPVSNGGKVRNVNEMNKQILDAVKYPPKVRKEAEAIYKLVSEGKLDPSDLDALVAEGLDKEAVSYYKKYFGQVDGGSEFSNELAKEHVKAKMEEELNTFKVKMARAYEVAYDMVSRGLCHDDKSSISLQVDEIMKFNDENFDTLKRVVARHEPMRKEAGKFPQVGMVDSGDFQQSAPVDDWAALSAALGKSKRMF